MKHLSQLTRCLTAFVVLVAVPVCLRADSRIEKTLDLAPGGRFVLEADAGSVDLTGRSGSGAHIVATSRYDDLEKKFDFAFEASPGLVRVVIKKKESGFLSWFGSTHAPSLTIEVPSRTTLAIRTGGGHVEVSTIRGDAELETSGGHMEISDLTGKLHAQTSGGHITLRDVVGDADVATSGGHIDVTALEGSLRSETSGGHITLKDVSGDIETSTSGGHIAIERAGGRVKAETSGGSVEVSFSRGNGRGGELESSGGSITVAIDPSLGFAIDAETAGGTVSSDVPVSVEGKRSRSALKGTIGRGGETIRLHTSAGSISIEPLGGA